MPDDVAPVGARHDASGMTSDFRGLSIDDRSERQAQIRITGQGVVATDITKQFTEAVSVLEPGEIIRDEYFTLFESVGALEIMDPKMDSGCLPLDGDDDHDDDYDVARPLEPDEALGIIDQLLCLEMAWHLGYPLSQTLFTSTYVTALVARPLASVDEAGFVVGGDGGEDLPLAHCVLLAYCLALAKTCWHVLQNVSSQMYYEAGKMYYPNRATAVPDIINHCHGPGEEDFGTNTYHVSLLESIEIDGIRHAVQDARRRLAAAAAASSKAAGAADVAAATTANPHSVLLALDARLAFREAFLWATEPSPDPDAALFAMQPDVALKRAPWLEMKTAATRFHKTHGLGTPVPGSFSVKAQRRLASTMPPRPIVQPSFDEACEQWLRFSEDGAEAIGVLSCADSQSVLNYVLLFQAKQPQPLVFIRTLVQSLIFEDNIMLGNRSIRQVLDDDLALVVLPASALLDGGNDDVEVVGDPRFNMAREMEEFRQRVFPPYLDMLRMLCQNRSRTRRMLYHAIQEWDRVQMDAEELDQVLQVALDERPVALRLATGARTGADAEADASASNGVTAYALPLSSWAYFYKLQLMEWSVQLGFELEIYQADELAGMYWYLCYLAKRRLQHAERMQTFMLHRLTELRRESSGSGSGSGRSGSGSKALAPDVEDAFRRSLTFLRTTTLQASVTWELADALSCLYAVLYRTGLVKSVRGEDMATTATTTTNTTTTATPTGTTASTTLPPARTSAAELRYELRMRPFAAVGLPELPSYGTFVAEVEQPENGSAAVLQYAEAAVAGAKKACEVLARMDAAASSNRTVNRGGGGGDEKSADRSNSGHERWLAATKNTLKSAILAGIAVAMVQKTMAADDASSSNILATKLTVRVPKPSECYHQWWIVPKITPAAKGNLH